MGYVENHLSRGETVVLKAKKNALYLLFPAILLAVALICAGVLQAVINSRSDVEGALIEGAYKMENLTDADRAQYEEDIAAMTEEEKQAQVEQYNRDIDTWNKGDLGVTFHHITDVSQVFDLERARVRAIYLKQYREMDSSEKAEMASEYLEYGLIQIHPIVASVLSVLMWAIVFFAFLLQFLRRLIKFFTFSLALTNKRVVGKAGLLRVHSVDFPIDKIDHVEINAGIFGNLLKYAELRVKSVSGTGLGFSSKGGLFVGIRNAQEFKDAVTEAVERHADEARKAQANEIARAMGGAYPGQPYGAPPAYGNPPYGNPPYGNPPHDPTRRP